MVAVERPDQFLVLASWLSIGDYVTRPDPRLMISVKTDQELSSGAWIKLVGIYLDKYEIDRIEPSTRTARFYDLVPGRYFILLLTKGGVACAKQVDFLKAPAKLQLSLSRNACRVETDLSANVRE